MIRYITIITISIATMLLLSCGTEPTTNSQRVQLQAVDNQPYVEIAMPEEPEGSSTESVTNVVSHAGRVYSYTKRIAYDNIIIVRDITDIQYYSYWWLNGKIRSYRENRTFEPSNESTIIIVDNCQYNASGFLRNYRAFIDGLLYYYGEEFNPDTMDYSGPSSPN
ncbi:MAG: hypothetical protein ACP5G4_03235 [bacterium]